MRVALTVTADVAASHSTHAVKICVANVEWASLRVGGRGALSSRRYRRSARLSKWIGMFIARVA